MDEPGSHSFDRSNKLRKGSHRKSVCLTGIERTLVVRLVLQLVNRLASAWSDDSLHQRSISTCDVDVFSP